MKQSPLDQTAVRGSHGDGGWWIVAEGETATGEVVEHERVQTLRRRVHHSARRG
jgi:hypothetical protein